MVGGLYVPHFDLELGHVICFGQKDPNKHHEVMRGVKCAAEAGPHPLAFLQPLKLSSSNEMSNKNEQNWCVTSNLTSQKEKLLPLKYLSLYLQAKDGHTSDPTSHQQMN